YCAPASPRPVWPLCPNGPKSDAFGYCSPPLPLAPLPPIPLPLFRFSPFFSIGTILNFPYKKSWDAALFFAGSSTAGGQYHPHQRATVIGLIGDDRPTVIYHGLLNDGEPQAGAWHRARLDRTVDATKDLLPILNGDTRPRVRDSDFHGFLVAFAPRHPGSQPRRCRRDGLHPNPHAAPFR